MKIRQSFRMTIQILSTILLIFSCINSKEENQKLNEIIIVEYPEVYELANIILALTEYGKNDKLEVRHDFDYYSKVMEYFRPVNKHPLLDSVNYSREKWDYYLSFRTDAYAFEFDNRNQLKRKINFSTNERLQPFDDHLELVNDFVLKSNFRAFFEQNKDYYQTLISRYKKTQYLREMREFLIHEFGEQYSSVEKYKVVLSTFVYRMNCHRDIDATTVADFITIPDYILSDTISLDEQDLASSIHLLFTEMDHGYVNPTTEQYKELVAKNFDATLWNNKSGYNEYEFAVFNEYMTWAVYDIFLEKHFPDFAEEVGLNWSFQNESRGFKYSHLFTQQLLTLYNQKEDGETLKDLYPKMLEWTSAIQKELSKPEITIPRDSLSTKFIENTKIAITFSESMQECDTLSSIFHFGKGFSKVIDLKSTENHLRWTENGKQVEFEFDLLEVESPCFFQFNRLGIKYPLISKKGILAKRGEYFKVINK